MKSTGERSSLFAAFLLKNFHLFPLGSRLTGVTSAKRVNTSLVNLVTDLTCATFVMAVFDTYHIPLLRTPEWPAASLQDQGWQGLQVQWVQLNRGPFVAEGVKQHIGAPRYKPEHVTAGAVSAGRPLGLARANKLGARIVRELLASYPG